MSRTLSGTYPTGVTLTNPPDSPVTVTGSISSAYNGLALYGGSTSGQPDYHYPWNITNLGRITGVGTSSTGILLEGGGSVTNGQAGAGAYISGGVQGLSIAQVAGSVLNFGSIVATATHSTGVFLHAGGTLTNLGVITGSGAGVKITGSVGSVANYGTIAGSGTNSAYGVVMDATVSNYLSNGAVGYIGEPDGLGVFSPSGAGAATVVNSGTISRGVLFEGGGTITNGHTGSTRGLLTAGFGGEINGGPGTVVNYGSILNGNLFGILFNDGGSFSNAQPGAALVLSNYGEDGVIIYGGLGTATNLGTVLAFGTDGGDAIFLKNGGTVVNGSSSVTTALISDNPFVKDIGVEVRNASGTVTNFGTILGGYGVFLRADGNVSNIGTASYIGGQYFGVIIQTTAAHSGVTNLGTIKALGANNNPGFGSFGVRLIGGGKVTNGSSLDTTALIHADMTGVATVGGVGTISTGVVIGGAGTVVNFGTISSTRTAVDAYGGGRLTNGSSSSHAALLSAGEYGVYVASTGTANSTVTNFGTITGYGTSGIGVALIGATNNTLTNAGRITGGGGIAAAFGGGNDRLVVGPGAVFKGVVNAGSGTNEIDFGKIGTVRLGPEYLGFSVVRLANGGSNSLTIAQSDVAGFAAGFALVVHGGNGANTVNAGAMLAGHRLVYDGVSGKDKITGGADNDTFSFAAAALTATDTIMGGAGRDLVLVTTGGAVSVSHVTQVEVFKLDPSAADTIALVDANFSGVAGATITVAGGNAGDTINASRVTGTNRVIESGGLGKDTLIGGAGNDVFEFAAAALTNVDRVNGEGGDDTLDITTGGVAGLGGISGIETVRLSSAGGDAISLVDANFTGITGTAITVVGGSAGNSVNAGSVSATHQVVFVGGAGTDAFTGGAGNDTFEFTAATLTSADTVVGGPGADRLVLTTSGAVNATGVSGVETYRLANGGADSLILTNGNFAGVTGKTITVAGGNDGNTVSEAGVAAGDKAILDGGADADTLIAGQHATMTGGSGADVFEFTTPGTTAVPDRNAITDFTHGSDKIAFSNAGFELGLAGASSTLRALPAVLFVANTTGQCIAAAQRFAYNTATGNLFYDADGSGTASSHQFIASLTGPPALAVTDLFYIS